MRLRSRSRSRSKEDNGKNTSASRPSSVDLASSKSHSLRWNKSCRKCSSKKRRQRKNKSLRKWDADLRQKTWMPIVSNWSKIESCRSSKNCCKRDSSSKWQLELWMNFQTSWLVLQQSATYLTMYSLKMVKKTKTTKENSLRLMKKNRKLTLKLLPRIKQFIRPLNKSSTHKAPKSSKSRKCCLCRLLKCNRTLHSRFRDQLSSRTWRFKRKHM